MIQQALGNLFGQIAPKIGKVLKLCLERIKKNPETIAIIGGGAAAGVGVGVGLKVGEAKGHTKGKIEGVAEQAQKDAKIIESLHEEHEKDREEWKKINKKQQDLLDQIS